jgi:ornithine carbamoyltransferase
VTRHLLDIADLDAAELRNILDLAFLPPERIRATLAGQGACLLFEKPSARTRHSAELAVVQLGGHPVYTREDEVGFDVRESVEDVTRILAGYHALLAARVRRHETLVRMAAVSSVPVVNLLSDTSHPLQAIADILTMEAHLGPVANLRVAWIGDFNNVARSLAEAVCHLGGTVVAGCPDGYGPTQRDLDFAAGSPGSLSWETDPRRAVRGCHAVHTDTWVSMGQESESGARMELFRPYRVDAALMAEAAPGVRFMHCMPAHRGEEVTSEVFDGPTSLVVAQGHARLPSARAAFMWVTSSTGEAK